MFGKPAKLKKSPSNLRFSGTSAKPAWIAWRGLANRTSLPFQAIVPDSDLIESEQRAGDFGAPGAEHAADGEDLAR